MTTDERPDGALSGLFWEYDRQVAAVRRHAAAEGAAVDTRTVLVSYDRTLHPIMHGRRFEDIADWVCGWATTVREVVFRG